MTKITNTTILSAFRKKMDLNKQDVATFADAFQSIFQEALLRDKVVKINGLGTFKLLLVEPRKSVNVNTGENIEIAGHYKLTFTPETALKNIVNQPLEHLETVELESKNEVEIAKISIAPTAEPQQDNIDDPLQKLAEQALELKDILADIQGLALPTNDSLPQPETTSTTAPSPDSEPINVESVAEPVAEPINAEPVAESVVEPINAEPLVEPVAEPAKVEQPVEPINTPQIEEPKPQTPSFISAQDIVAEMNRENNKATRQHSKAWIGVAIILLLAVVGLLLYQNIDLFVQPNDSNLNIADSTAIVSVDSVASSKLNQPIDTILPFDEDSLSLNDSNLDTITSSAPTQSSFLIDTTSPIYAAQFDDIFNQTRQYTEFIDTVTLNEGSRLTWISLKYLGHKDFWVYIYEANTDVISNPNSIRIGTQLRIPKLDPALIDVSNTQCFEYAKHLHDVYVKK
jgi:nucleoid DNA-binding protein/nucleoid-associated protein YgaU